MKKILSLIILLSYSNFIFAQGSSNAQSESTSQTQTKASSQKSTSDELPSDQLIDAVTNGDLNQITTLIKQGADPNAANSSGSPVLHIAIRTGRINGDQKYVNIVQYLLEHGADPLKKDLSHKDALDVLKESFNNSSNVPEATLDKYVRDIQKILVSYVLKNKSLKDIKASISGEYE